MIGISLPAASTMVLPPAAEQAAMFRAAGFVARSGGWGTTDCAGQEGSYSPGHIDAFGDANQDGRPDAVISESSAMCYGMAGTKFWVLAKDAAGKWQVMTAQIGMPEFLDAKGAAGWPDLQVGGPGFCFPVLRWDGKSYRFNRHQYEGKPCRPGQ